jgi:gamma-glutamyltranspeptidase
VNYREWGVGAATRDAFENDPDADAPTHGGKAVCVPGTVAGLLHCLEKYGTMDRRRVLEPEQRRVIALDGRARQRFSELLPSRVEIALSRD